MRSLVFSCATTVAPPARSGALLSVWSKCQCVLITNFTGAPNPLSDSWSLGHAGATNVSTTTNPSEPCSTTTLPPGPASRVRFSASGCDSIGMAPMRARNAATGSCGCCRAPPAAARASLRGMSPSTSTPAPIAAIICNHSRRVLLVTLRLTVHPPLEVRCNMSRGESRARVRLRQDQAFVLELNAVRMVQAWLSEHVRERDQRYRHNAAPLPRVWHSRCGDALSFCRRLWTRHFRDSGPQHAATVQHQR